MAKPFNGAKEWRIDGLLHREDGPAIEYGNGTKAWFLNGKIHREDGPAVERADGTTEWYLNSASFGSKRPENWEELVKMAQVEVIMKN